MELRSEDDLSCDTEIKNPFGKVWKKELWFFETQLIKPNLHSVKSIDELPLPKNWTWWSNLKYWEDVKNEDPWWENSSNVFNYDYDTFQKAENNFLLDFIELH